MEESKKVKEEREFQYPEPRVLIKSYSPRSTHLVVDGVCLNNVINEFTYHVKAGENPILKVELEIDNDNVFRETPDHMKS